MQDEKGIRKADFANGAVINVPPVPWPEFANVGDTTMQVLVVEKKYEAPLRSVRRSARRDLGELPPGEPMTKNPPGPPMKTLGKRASYVVRGTIAGGGRTMTKTPKIDYMAPMTRPQGAAVPAVEGHP